MIALFSIRIPSPTKEARRAVPPWVNREVGSLEQAAEIARKLKLDGAVYDGGECVGWVFSDGSWRTR